MTTNFNYYVLLACVFNFAICSLLETTSIEGPKCGPCQSQDIFKAANKWCSTCEEGICDDCNVHHKANKASRYHIIVQVEQYTELQPFLSTLKTKCDLHDKPLELYCLNHENPCCSCCASINHATCLGLTSFNQITTEVRKSCHWEDIHNKLDDLLNNFDVIIKNRSANKTRLKKQSENRRYTVNELRKKINGYLDSLESQLLEKSENILTVESKAIEKLIIFFEKKKKVIIDLKHNFSNLYEFASDTQVFLGEIKVEEIMNIEEGSLLSMLNGSDAIESNLEFIIDPMIADSLSKLVDVHLKREKSTPSLNLQMTPSTCQIICDETAVLLTNFNTSAFTKDTIISSIMATLSGKIIVSDFSNKLLILFCKDGTISKTIQLKEVPFGLTGIKEDKFALSLPFSKTIHIYRMEDYEVDRKIQLADECWGLDFADDMLVVAIRNKEILYLDMTDSKTGIFTQIMRKV
ncbi:unnamed protein product [Mytilus coruscus]|uniref:B box-type domain-containing protein n=1 Tax=Mytilus coruscus TaxID=42192 RepID=A0A6J8C1B3_MYTCO|nr:unnamed protein product [Mytilus coruscus]